MTSSSHSNEHADLDRFLKDDSILLNSLQVEDQQRKKRRRVTILGVLIGTMAIATALLFSQSGLASVGDSIAAEGWQLWTQQKFIEAEEKFNQATAADPKSVSAWNGLGWSRMNQGKCAEALTAFQSCLKLEPNYPAALNGAGQALLENREYDDAKEYLLKAAPQANAAWYGLTRITLLQGNFEEAETWAQKVANLEPANEVNQKMLLAAKEKNLTSELRKLIEPSAETNGTAMKAWALFSSGKLAEAKTAFEKVLADDPENLSAANGFGFCLLNSGDVEKAKPYFQKCLEAEENAFGPMNGLARCLKIEGDLEGAIQLWKLMDEKIGQVNAGTVGLAETYLEQGNFKQAKTYFTRLVEANPGNREFQTRLEACEAGLKKSK